MRPEPSPTATMEMSEEDQTHVVVGGAESLRASSVSETARGLLRDLSRSSPMLLAPLGPRLSRLIVTSSPSDGDEVGGRSAAGLGGGGGGRDGIKGGRKKQRGKAALVAGGKAKRKEDPIDLDLDMDLDLNLDVGAGDALALSDDVVLDDRAAETAMQLLARAAPHCDPK